MLAYIEKHVPRRVHELLTVSYSSPHVDLPLYEQFIMKGVIRRGMHLHVVAITCMSLRFKPLAPCVGPLSRNTIISRTVLFKDYSRWHIMPTWVQPSRFLTALVNEQGYLCSTAGTCLVSLWGLKLFSYLCLMPKSIWGSQFRFLHVMSPCYWAPWHYSKSSSSAGGFSSPHGGRHPFLAHIVGCPYDPRFLMFAQGSTFLSWMNPVPASSLPHAWQSDAPHFLLWPHPTVIR